MRDRLYIPIIILAAAIMVNTLHCLLLKNKIKSIQEVVTYQTTILNTIVTGDNNE